MDPIRLGRHLASGGLSHFNSSGNVTLSSLPVTVMEAMIPGYPIISRFMSETFGIDISILVTVFAVFFASLKSFSYIASYFGGLIETYFMSSVHIEDSDDLYDNVLEWIADQKLTKQARRVKAKSVKGSAWDEDIDEKNAALSAVDDDGVFNYSRWQARVPPRYEPYYGSHRFRHNGRFFHFHRTQRPQQVVSNPWSKPNEDDRLELSCFGYSNQPVKNLLQEIKTSAIKKQVSRTTIRHPSGKTSRYGGQWSKTNSRPSRPMATVILDEKEKQMIQNDMNEFLHPSSPKWYATRGIPYRRGYLFHGPPGTGKTSLSFALAGIFGLDIYCIALNDPELTETDLRDLFNTLPRRCVVLLEDIDSAGIKRDDENDDDKKKTARHKKSDSNKDPQKADEDTSRPKAAINGKDKSRRDPQVKDSDNAKEDEKDETQWTLQDLARAIMTVSQASQSPTPTSTGRGRRGRHATTLPNVAGVQPKSAIPIGISLSGLLNAIDGVATHEGRVLVMTTNHREKLDPALIRTGRVDVQIEFTYAKRTQIRELFLRMYTPDFLPTPTDVSASKTVSTVAAAGKEAKKGIWNLDLDSSDKNAAMEELKEVAEKFAGEIPELEFTPSDIQGFLLLYKKQPRLAVDKVGEWRDGEMEKKNQKKKQEEDYQENDNAEHSELLA